MNENKTYPIERVLMDADHMVKVATELLAGCASLAIASNAVNDEETAENLAALEQAEGILGEQAHAMRLAMHEYRKRAQRFRDSLAESATAEQAEPTAPAVKESLTAEPQAEQATLCASCARANLDCPIYPQQTTSCIEHRSQQQGEPVAWVMFDRHGARTGWTSEKEYTRNAYRSEPLYAQPPAVPDALKALSALLASYERMKNGGRPDDSAERQARAMLAAAPQKDPRQAFAEYHLGKPFTAAQKGGA